MNKKKKAKRIRNLSILGAIIIIILIGMIYGCRKYTIKPVDNSIDTDEMQFSQFRDDESRLDNSLLSYGKVLNKYMDKKYEDYTGPDIEINANDYISTSGDPIRPFTEDYKPEDSDYTIKADPNAIIFTGDKLTTVTYEIVVPESKLYNLQFDYALFEGKNSDMQVGITIDGKKPFDEANNLNLKRCYEFYDSQEYDSQGNQIRPKQREVFKWQTKIASNPDGIYKNVYKMFLNKTPENKTTVIELTFSREPGAVSKISFIAPVKNISYDEYRNLPEIKDAPVYSGEILPPIQMEDPISKTDLGMRAESDSDYLSKPPSYDKMMYNVFGGDRWKYGGQSATWEFEVKESGWYEIVTRYSIQSDSITTYREISINGEIPFEDMEEYAFTNVSGWVGDPIKNLNGDPYLFYLHEGMNTITMTSKLGPIRNAIQSLTDLNDAVNDFLKILQQITASARDTAGNISVDKNMDWDLDKYIEDLPERLSSYTNVLNEQYDYIRTANGGKIPSYASSIAAAADLFKKLEKDHNIIPSQMNNILTSLNGISTSIVSMKEQPMSFDYMLIAPPNADYGNVRSNPFQSLLVGVKQFYFSFVKDYTAVGMPTVDKNVPEISIWVARGREWIE
ncbi:MAG: hypothetical protein LBI03_03375, partial [Clostridiales bacterium]|nr:hypothetical protein [Clostridiales bacterium]